MLSPCSHAQSMFSHTHTQIKVLSDCDGRLKTLQRCSVLPEMDQTFLRSAVVERIKQAVAWPRNRAISPGLHFLCRMPDHAACTLVLCVLLV